VNWFAWASSTHSTLLGIPKDVKELLKFYCGEKKPAEYDPNIKPKDRKGRRLFLTELTADDREKIVKYFRRNPTSIIKRVLRGSGGLPPDWLLIVRAVGKREIRLIRMDEAVDLFTAGSVRVTARGNLDIGGVTMQRKGATRDPRPNDLQFKVKLEPIWQAIKAKS
jgi:R.HinP1I restriction endonuclease